VGRLDDDSRPQVGPPPLDREIAALALRQYGVVSHEQLRVLGVEPRAIAHRLAAGRLHAVHRGVYAVGHAVLVPKGHWMAAVLACGSGAALSHASAAALWGMRRSAARYVDVTARRTGRKRPGIRIHRPRTLPPDEVATHEGIRTTTPARTILDMAAILSASRLEHLLDQAEIQELTDYPALDAIARAHPGHRGATRLGRALQTHYAATNLTRSDIEILFKELCRAHGLPTPRVNQSVADKEVDFLFPGERLVVETDSWRYHKTRHAFESDRARDVLLATAGYRTLRFTDRQLTRRPRDVATAIAAVLADRRAA